MPCVGCPSDREMWSGFDLGSVGVCVRVIVLDFLFLFKEIEGLVWVV